MTSYRLNKRFGAMFEPAPTLPDFTFGQLFELGKIMTRYDFLDARFVI